MRNHLRASAFAVATPIVVLLLVMAPGSAANSVQESDPVVSVVSQTVVETDRNQVVRIVVELDRPAEQTVRVRYSTVAGTATENQDYTRRTGLVTIPRNQTSRFASIVIRGDDDDEPLETFDVVLSDPTNAVLGSNATVTIEDDDEPFVPPVVSAVSATVTETDRTQTLRVNVQLDRPAERTVRVRYTTEAGSATENQDYTRRSGLVTIAKNRTSATAPISIRGDDDQETSETFAVVLSDPTDAALGSNAVITIEDDDDPPPVVSVVPLTVTETDRSQTLRVTIKLDRPAEKTTRVRYTTVAGTATLNEDYTRRVGTATIARNRSEVTVPVVIRGDNLQEPTETVDIILSAPSGAVLGDNGTIIIEDDDDPPHPWLGWFEAQPRYQPSTPELHVLDRASISGDPYQAVVQALGQHGDVQLIGTFDFDRSLPLQSGQTLRGAGPNSTLLRFSGSGSGIRADLGGIAGPGFSVDAAAAGSRTLRLDQPNSGAFTVGRLAVLSLSDANAAPLTVMVEALPDPSTVVVANPLARDVADGEQMMALNRDPLVGVGVDGLTIEAVGDVDRLISFRGVVEGWVHNVHSRNPKRSHFDANFSIGCEVSGSFFDDASSHGDGGQGYGVSLANGTSRCLIEDNEFRYLRHSMILNDGAAANALVFNHSWEAHHPNFPVGGPPDILMHGLAYNNLVEGNVVERIFIGDRPTGGGNVFVRNCLTTSPLSYQHGSGVQVLVGNAMYGSDAVLQTLRMEDRWPDHEPFPGSATTLPFLPANTTIFDGNGLVRIQPVAGAEVLPDPAQLDNWFDRTLNGPQSGNRQPLTVFTGNQPILTAPQSASWIDDCAIDAATGPGRGVNRP